MSRGGTLCTSLFSIHNVNLVPRRCPLVTAGPPGTSTVGLWGRWCLGWHGGLARVLIRFRRCSIHGQVRLGQLRWLIGLLDVFPVARVCVCMRCLRPWPRFLTFREETLHCLDYVFRLPIRLWVGGLRRHVVKFPGPCKYRELSRSKLGTIICDQHIRDAKPCEDCFQLLNGPRG